MIATCGLFLALFNAAQAPQARAPQARATQAVSPSEWPWELVDVAGTVHRPFDSQTTRGAVLVFITTDCPIVNYFQPTIARLARELGPQGFSFFLVHADPAIGREEVNEHAKRFDITIPVILDPLHALARWVGATVTPEAAVVDRRGQVRYLGRIDDTYADYGKKRPPRSHDLRAALADLAANRPVARPRTQVVGCLIPYREP